MANADSFEADHHSSDSLVQKLKIAVAVGCIRSKPRGVSGREYAQQLCDKFQRDQLEWKERYEKAEIEILHLKQQLALQQNNVAEQMEIDYGSGSEVLFPTPPSSGSHIDQNIHEGHSKDDINNSLSRHTLFLHHVISLQTGSKLLAGNSIDSITKRSIQQSLGIIKDHTGDATISNKLQVQSIININKLYSKCDNELKQEVLENVKISAEKLIARIISKEQYRTQDQTRHVELLQELSKGTEINAPVIELLADNILGFSDRLRMVVIKGEPLDPYSFTNIYLIINTLRQCLKFVNNRIKGSEELRDQIVSKLEDSLLHLTDKFPLFAHAIWRITAILNT